MTYLQNMMSDVAAYAAYQAAVTAAADDEPIDPAMARYLASLKAELLNTSVQTCVAASIANALTRGILPGRQIKSVATYLPLHSAFFDASLSQIAGRQDISFHIAQSVLAYTSRLSLARKLATACAQFAINPADRDTADPVDAAIVSDSLRRTCRAALHLNGALSTNRKLGPARDVDANELNVLSLLEAAKSGGWPCLDENGQIAIPGWAERRRAPRVSCSVPALILRGTATFEGHIFNVSTGGVGLTADVSEGDRIRIRIEQPEPRELSGMVAWAADGHAGVKFDQRLAIDDPLLARV